MLLSTTSTREDRWRFIETLLQRWLPTDPTELRDLLIPQFLRSPTFDESFDPQGLRLAESRMNIAVPLAIRQFYERFSNYGPFWSLNELLQPPSRLDCQGDRLVFLVENQSVMDWGVSVSAGGDDPPVTVREIDPRPNLECEGTFSEFMVGFTIHHLVFTPNASVANGPLQPHQVAVVKSQLSRVSVADWHWPGFPTRFFATEDVVAELDSDEDYTYSWLWIAARTREAFAKFESPLLASGVRWECRSIDET